MSTNQNKIINFSYKLDDIYIKLGFYVSFLFLVVVVIGFFEVVSRYVFDAPTLWVHETTTFFISLSLLYGGVACYASENHIAMLFIRQQFSNKRQWQLKLLVEVLTLTFFIMLSYGSFISAKEAFFTPFGTFKMQTSGTYIDMPFPAISKAFLLLTCLMMLVSIVLHIYRHLCTPHGEKHNKEAV